MYDINRLRVNRGLVLLHDTSKKSKSLHNADVNPLQAKTLCLMVYSNDNIL
jgi:hypothetical protein